MRTGLIVITVLLALAVPAARRDQPRPARAPPRFAPTTARATGAGRSRSRPTRPRRTSPSARSGKHAAKKPALVLDIDETSLNNYTAAPDVVAADLDPEPDGLLHRRRPRLRPAHPMRPAELLALQGRLHHRRGPRGARRRGQAHGAGARREGASTAQVRAILQPSGCTRTTSRKRGARSATRARLIPLIGAPIGAIQNGRATGAIGKCRCADLQRRSRRGRRRAPPRRSSAPTRPRRGSAPPWRSPRA